MSTGLTVETESNLFQTGLLALAISILLWYLFKPQQQRNDRRAATPAMAPGQRVPPPRTAAQQQHVPLARRDLNNTPTARRQRVPTNMGNAAASSNSDYDEDSFMALLKKHQRIPPHFVSSTSSSNTSLTAISGMTVPQHEGILPFRFTRAATYETKLSSSTTTNTPTSSTSGSTTPSMQLMNRKDRARLFTKVFASFRTEGSNLTSPPSRGSNIVVSILSTDAGCHKLSRVLYLLASYYNLFVLMNLEDGGRGNDEGIGGASAGVKMDDAYTKDKKRLDELIHLLRGGHDGSNNETSSESDKGILPEEVLPSHRIVTTTSLTGKVAFVRQLPKRPEFVLDYEEEMKTELHRFGFTVLLYSKRDIIDGKTGQSQVSSLGYEMSP